MSDIKENMMLRKSLIFLTLTGVAGSALAAPVVNLNIKGDIKPPACTINGGNNDILFNYGNISPTVIPQNKDYRLGKISADIEVLCDATTYLTFTPKDSYTINSADSTIKDEVFGLVSQTENNKEVGRVSFNIKGMKVDGNSVFLGRSGIKTATAEWWSYSLVRNAVMGWTSQSQPHLSSPDELKLVPGKVFSATLSAGENITASGIAGSAILSKNALSANGVETGGKVDFIGNVTLVFNFGI